MTSSFLMVDLLPECFAIADVSTESRRNRSGGGL